MKLNNTESPINRSERMKINENWAIITSAMQTLNAQLLEIKAIDHMKEIDRLHDIQNRLETLHDNMAQFTANQIGAIDAAIADSKLATKDAVQLVTTINNTKAEIDAIAVDVRQLIADAQAATTDAQGATAAAQTATADTQAAAADTRAATAAMKTDSQAAIDSMQAATQQAINDNKAATDAVIAQAQADTAAAIAANQSATDAAIAQVRTDAAATISQVQADSAAATAAANEATTAATGATAAAITQTQAAADATAAAITKTAEMQQLGTDLTAQVAQTIADAETAIIDALDEADAAVSEMQAAMQAALNLQTVGSWSPTVQYKANNIVEHEGSSFIALIDNVNAAPPTVADKHNNEWALLARRGIDGLGSVVTVNGQAPDTAGNVEIIIPPSITKWGELEDVPAEFTPAAHLHKIADIEGLQTALMNNGQATMTKERDIFTAAAGQTVFELSSAYVVGSNLLAVTVGGVPQVEGVHFTETSERSFTLVEAAPEGELVVAEYYSGFGGLSAIPNADETQQGLMTPEQVQALADALAQAGTLAAGLNATQQQVTAANAKLSDIEAVATAAAAHTSISATAAQAGHVKISSDITQPADDTAASTRAVHLLDYAAFQKSAVQISDPTIDWNMLTKEGIYNVSVMGINAPNAYPYGLLIVLKSQHFYGGLTQLFFSHTSAAPFIRSGYDDGKSSWTEWEHGLTDKRTGIAANQIYEEGTWTPTLVFNGNGSGVQYLMRTGSYKRIGRTVHFECFFALTSKGTAAGGATINGLPFVAANPYTIATSRGEGWNIGYDLGNIQALIISNYVRLESFKSGALSTLTDAHFTNYSTFAVSGFYKI